MTSHDAVFQLRRILGEKKIGHGGTLDPDVTGVLPIAVGKATRLIEYMQEGGKVYEGEVTLGFSTTTEDASGEIVERTPVPDSLTAAAVDAAMAGFLGEITQVPPLYSAVKVKGRRLYEYARSGEPVERPQRRVIIRSFERLGPLSRTADGLVYFPFRTACSKGTYVRTLAVDLGAKLGLASHMSALQRTASAGLLLADSRTLAEIANQTAARDFSFLLPLEAAVRDLPRIDLTAEQGQAVTCGQFLTLDREEAILAAFQDDSLLAILEKRGTTYKPRKVLRS